MGGALVPHPQKRGEIIKQRYILKLLGEPNQHVLDAAVAAGEVPRAPKKARGLVLSVPGGGIGGSWRETAC